MERELQLNSVKRERETSGSSKKKRVHRPIFRAGKQSTVMRPKGIEHDVESRTGHPQGKKGLPKKKRLPFGAAQSLGKE